MTRGQLSVMLLVLAGCGQPASTARTRQITLTPEQQWVSAEDGPEAFAEVRAFQVDHRGNVYILDGQTQVVQVFGPTGVHLRTLGRKGSGPGELNRANGIILDGEDRLWVYDPGNRRVTVFDTAGQLVISHQLTINMYGYVWTGGLDPEGRLVDDIYIPDRDRGRTAITRIDLATGRADTFPLPKCQADTVRNYEFPRGVMGVPYASGPYYRLDPHGYTWCGDTRLAAVAQYHLGDTVPFRRFEVAVEPAPVTAAARDSGEKQVREFVKQIGAEEPDLSRIPATRAVLQRVDLDDRGRVWMQIQEKRGQRVVVFDSTGTPVAEGTAPFRTARWLPIVVRGDMLYAQTRDSLDVTSVTRFRVRMGE